MSFLWREKWTLIVIVLIASLFYFASGAAHKANDERKAQCEAQGGHIALRPMTAPEHVNSHWRNPRNTTERGPVAYCKFD